MPTTFAITNANGTGGIALNENRNVDLVGIMPPGVDISIAGYTLVQGLVIGTTRVISDGITRTVGQVVLPKPSSWPVSLNAQVTVAGPVANRGAIVATSVTNPRVNTFGAPSISVYAASGGVAITNCDGSPAGPSSVTVKYSLV